MARPAAINSIRRSKVIRCASPVSRSKNTKRAKRTSIQAAMGEELFDEVEAPAKTPVTQLI
jgi:hypothetical protein